MAGTSRASNDLWHRSLEDLLQALETGQSGATGGGFVINLHTSAAPISPPAKSFPQFDGLRVYVLQRRDQSAAHFQLRLGIIQSDLQADAILAAVRGYYPNATKLAVDETDRTAIARAAAPPQPVVPAASAANPTTPVPHAPAQDTAPAARGEAEVEEPRWDIDELLPDLMQAPPSSEERPTPTGAAPRALPAPVVAMPASSNKTPTPAPPAVKPAPKAQAESNQLKPAGDGAVVQRPLPRPPTVGEGQAPLAARAAHRAALAPVPAQRPSPRSTPAPSPRPKPRPKLAAAPKQPPAAAGGGPNLSAVVAERPPSAAPPASRSISEPVSTAARTPGAALRSPQHPVGDSGVLRSVVDKIGTMIDAVEAHEEGAAARRTTPPRTSPIAAATAAAAASQPAASQPPPLPTPPTVFPIAIPKPPAAASERTSNASIDSTRTVRALTAVELADAEASTWFAIQLMRSDEQIEAEQVPDLDIFGEYRLYSVAEPDAGAAMHALRVGFFSSEVAAQAVAGYLSSYFPGPAIKRVSAAERERFAEQLVVARKDVGAAGSHAVIEFAGAPPPLEVRVDTPASDGSKRSTNDTTSLWSRLKGLRSQR